MSWTLVTGGVRGLGRQIALALAEQGRDLVIQYKSSIQEAKALVEELRAKGVNAEMIQGDFSKHSSVQEFLERYLAQFSSTRSLIWNVGHFHLGSALETNGLELQMLFQTNVFACQTLIKALLPSLKNLQGEVLAIGMVGSSDVRANTHAFGYNLTKQALWMLIKSLAKELAVHGVRVNMVSPGYMEGSIDLPTTIGQIPMNRLAQHREVAHLAAFLMESANSYITGQNIEVAGGVRL